MCARVLMLLWLIVIGPGLARADEEKDKPAPRKEELADQQSVTTHEIKLGERALSYTATAGTLVLKEEEGKPRASIFYTAYVKQGEDDPAARPLLFSFNGGPGSSSVWLHLGLFGPRRVVMGEPTQVIEPPGKLVDNESTLLDVADLVFVDPVTTGYSRPAPGQDAQAFHSVQGDIESVAEFIRLYCTRAKRWTSPKFIAGESYGTTRAAGLSGYLQDHLGIYLNGVILISAILNWQTVSDDRGNDLPYALFLPSFAAAAWYHQRLASDLQRDLRTTLAEVEQFAAGDYTLALMQGSALGEAERHGIAQRLARYTGLSPEFIDRANLRVSMERFTKELLRAERRTLGRLDSRYLGIDSDAAGETFQFDASYAAIQGPFTAALNDYVRRELHFESDLPYEILTGRVHPWSFGSSNRYLDVADTLRSAMTQNQALHVFVAGGYYDFATPYFAAQYTIDHMGIDPSLRGHLTFEHYEAGHMMYIHAPSLLKLKQDLVQFMHRALANQ